MPENYMRLHIFINKDIKQTIKAKQYDALSRFLDITLINDDGIPIDLTDCRVQFNARKPDMTHIMNDAVITEPLNGRFTVELTDQTLAVGDNVVKADISVFTNDAYKILTTRTFKRRQKNY